MSKTELHAAQFNIGDIVIESLFDEVIGKYIICHMEAHKQNIDDVTCTLYILWSSGYWDEKQGNLTTLSATIFERNETSPYRWKKL
tara:strand:- start:73 stop:330 length:258 start_codon:yes stop_codon:yes gene_type:complete